MLSLGRSVHETDFPPSSEAPQPRFLQLAEPDRAIPLALSSLVGIVLFASRFHSIPSGDAAENVYQVEVVDLVHRAPFVGYHALGIVFDRLLGLLGLDTITTLESMSALFGALLALFTYRLARQLAFQPLESLLAALLSSFSGVVWAFGSMADTYIVHTCLALISQVCFLERRFVWSGVCFGLAMLCYPSSVALTAPFYVIAAVWKRYRVREMLPMPAFAFLVYAPPVLILFQEYFWGRMGIFQAANNLDGIFNESMNGFQFHILARGGFYLLSSLHLALPFLALGAVLTARRRHVLIALALSLVPIPLWNHFLQANFTDSYLITVYPWLGLLASVGLGSAARRIGSLRLRAAVLASFFALYGTLSFTSWVDPIHRRSDELQSLAESLESRRSSSDRVFGSWGTAVRYNWYTTGTLRDGACDYYERTDRELLLRRLSEPGGVYVIDEVPLSTPLKRLVGANRESARRELDWWEDADLGVQLTPTDLANGSFRVWRARID